MCLRCMSALTVARDRGNRTAGGTTPSPHRCGVFRIRKRWRRDGGESGGGERPATRGSARLVAPNLPEHPGIFDLDHACLLGVRLSAGVKDSTVSSWHSRPSSIIPSAGPRPCAGSKLGTATRLDCERSRSHPLLGPERPAARPPVVNVNKLCKPLRRRSGYCPDSPRFGPHPCVLVEMKQWIPWGCMIKSLRCKRRPYSANVESPASVLRTSPRLYRGMDRIWKFRGESEERKPHGSLLVSELRPRQVRPSRCEKKTLLAILYLVNRCLGSSPPAYPCKPKGGHQYLTPRDTYLDCQKRRKAKEEEKGKKKSPACLFRPRTICIPTKSFDLRYAVSAAVL